MAHETTVLVGLAVVKTTLVENPRYPQFVADQWLAEERVQYLPDGAEAWTLGQFVEWAGGIDEGEPIVLRFPTVDEDRARLAAVVDRSLHTWDGPTPEAPRDGNGLLVNDPDAAIFEARS